MPCTFILPSVLGLLGHRINAAQSASSARRFKTRDSRCAASEWWARWGSTITRRPWTALLIGRWQSSYHDTMIDHDKNTNWEGAFRVPLLVRWPGEIAAGSISNEIVQHDDWLPTFSRHRREVQERAQGGREDLQGAHRRIQPAAVSGRKGAQEPSQGILLLR